MPTDSYTRECRVPGHHFTMFCLSVESNGMSDPEGAVEVSDVTGWGRNDDLRSEVSCGGRVC